MPLGLGLLWWSGPSSPAELPADGFVSDGRLLWADHPDRPGPPADHPIAGGRPLLARTAPAALRLPGASMVVTLTDTATRVLLRPEGGLFVHGSSHAGWLCACRLPPASP